MINPTKKPRTLGRGDSLNSGANINAKDKDGFTALMIATFLDRLEVAQLLIQSRSNINLKNKNGDTAISLAKQYSRSAILESLLIHQQYQNLQSSINIKPQLALHSKIKV